MKKHQFILLLFLCLSCNTIQITSNKEIAHTSTTKQTYLKAVKELYTDYKNLSVSFFIKGRDGESEYSYIGKLVSKYENSTYNLSIQLKDPILETLLLEIVQSNGIIHIKKYFDNTTYQLSKYASIDFMGLTIPLYLLLPILTGIVPEDLYKYETEFSEAMRTFKVYFNSYESLITFKNYLIHEYFLKEKVSKKIIHIEIDNYISSNNRKYPGILLIHNQNKSDFVKIKFSNLIII